MFDEYLKVPSVILLILSPFWTVPVYACVLRALIEFFTEEETDYQQILWRTACFFFTSAVLFLLLAKNLCELDDPFSYSYHLSLLVLFALGKFILSYILVRSLYSGRRKTRLKIFVCFFLTLCVGAVLLYPGVSFALICAAN